MRIFKVKTLDGLKLISGVPFFQPDMPKHNVDFTYYSNDEMFPLLAEHFIEPVNQICKSLIDIYDNAYLTVEQCVPLIEWLNLQIEIGDLDIKLREFYVVLKRYAEYAVRHNTGVGFDL